MIRSDHQACIVLGSNISPAENIRSAVLLLRACLTVRALSTTWETPPVGTDGPNFYNVAAQILTNLDIKELKEKILRPIEAQLGRVRAANKFAARTIDLDIIVFDDHLLEDRMWDLPYLAVPLSELLPDYLHPVSGESLSQIAQRFLEKDGLVPRPEVLDILLF